MSHISTTVIIAAFLALSGKTYAQGAGDAVKGERVFAKCRSCHSLEEGKKVNGPSLHGLFGRKAGSVPGYPYSATMKNSTIVWNDETLTAYLLDPRRDFRDSKMTFPGLKDSDQIKDLLAYLKEGTK